MGVPRSVSLLHNCAEVRAAIELSFKTVSGVTPDIHVLDGGPRASSGRGEFWNHLPHWLKGFNVALIVCGTMLLYAVYICHKSLNFTYTFKCYQQNCKLASL